MEDNIQEQTLDELYNDKDITPPREYPRMKKRTKAIVKYIERQLGGQVLDLELTPSDIKDIIDDSFMEVKHYIEDIYTITVPYAECMDLTPYNVHSVESVMRCQDSILTGTVFPIPALSYISTSTGVYDIDDYVNALQVKRNLNIISTDMQFHWDGPNKKLYLVANQIRPNSVTIYFKPEYYSIEDIHEDYWDTQIRKLALGQCKIAIGRIRSKYTSNSAKFQLDGNTLLQEGTAEVQEVRQRLDANRNLFTVLN